MAVLQKIRNRGILLVSCIAVALFLFVIGDLLRGGEGLINQSRQTVGEINGTSVSIQEYQTLFEEFQTYQEVAQQRSGFSEDENNQLKDAAWQTFVQNQLIEDECQKLGIAVTDDEISQVIQTGASQLLQVPVFANQQTGAYDYGQLQNFLTEYSTMKESGEQVPEAYEKIYKYYLFAQKQIRAQLLSSKYQNLLSLCFFSNPIEAKQAFADRTNESDIYLVSVPFSSITDDQVTVSDADIKAKYEADKEKYKQFVETRDMKIVDVVVTASDEDKKALEADMAECYNQLAAAEKNDVANIIRQNSSVYPYSDVLKSKDAFPILISSHLGGDSASVAVGQTLKPVYDPANNAYVTFKVMEKATQADSVLFRQMAVYGKDEADTKTKTDSILNAISAGAKFKDIAKKYGQVGDSAWIATAQFQNASLDADNALYIRSIYDTNSGETKKVTLTNGTTIIIQVMEKRNPIEKYNIAAIVKELRFSDETYKNEYNKFSAFVASNATLEDIEANAEKSGYTVRPITDVTSTSHNIAGIHNSHDALRWLFEEAQPGNVSQLYECGDNNHLLLVALTGINKEGYASIDKVTDAIKQELINDKKAEKIIADSKSVKDIAAAKKLPGAVADSVNHVSFAAPAFIVATTLSEPIVSALAAKTAKGAFAGPVKGNAGVFMLQVLDKKASEEKYDEKAEMEQSANMAFRYVSQNILNDLYMKANVKDSRHKFF